MRVTLGRVIFGSKSDAILGTSDREVAIDFINRAIELAADHANWDIWLDNLDICSDGCGVVTLPSFVDTVLQVNVGGRPTVFRSDWFQFHLNGPGSECCGPACGFSDDQGWSPIFQDLKEWSVVAAICEDAIDGNGTLEMIVEGETKDANLNTKTVYTIPATGPSTAGIKIPLLINVANTVMPLVYFRKITRVTKPVTRGYVKLIAFPIRQMALPATLGYYEPYETTPMYRRIKVACSCKWVRVRYRKSESPLVNDWDILPLASYQASLDLIKSVRLSDANNIKASEAYLAKAIRLLKEIQGRDATYTPMVVEPGFGVGCIDPR
jgi:hypothetical protein